MSLRVVLWLIAASLPLVSAGAQRRPPVDRLSDTVLSAAVTQTMGSETRGALFPAAVDGGALYVLNTRTAPSQIELHCAWDDILVVRSGAGVMRYGRKLRGLERYSWAEWRAKELVSPGEVSLAAGDVLRVPAGEAHEVTPLGDAPLVYLVVKVRSPDERACASLPQRGK